MALTPILINASTRRTQIHAKAIEGVQSVFPLEARGHRIEIDNVHMLPKEYSSREQKEAVLNGHTLQEPLKADVVLRDTTTNQIVQRKDGMTLAQVPWFTPRHTFIVDGNEYSVGNQRRVRPGVYTRVRGNEELEAAFNLGRGENFRIRMDPAKGHMYLQYGTTNIPLYPVLKHLGVTDGELNKAWGSGVVVQNKGAFGTKSEKALDKLYERLVPEFRRTHQTPEAKAEAIHESYRNTVLDPIVTERTLGEGFTHVTPSALVKASQKMLNVHREGAETDDRDNLAVQSLHSVDDFIKERIQLEGRNLAKKVKMKASMTATPDLDRIVPASPFTRTLRGFITQSSLSAIPTQINPVEIIDSATRVTTLGEGGIESERAIPTEARQLHHTHFGFIDPARTPECYVDDMEVFTAMGWRPWSTITKGDLLACRIDDHLEFHPPRTVVHQAYEGPIYGVKTSKIHYAVTPNHRVLCRPLDRGATWRISRADDVYGRPRAFDTGHAAFLGDAVSTFALPTVTSRPKNCFPAHGGELTDTTINVNTIPMSVWASFMGWYLAEGCTTYDEAYPTYCVHISQSCDANPEKCRIIEDLLKQLPFKWHYSQNAFHIGVKQLAAYLKDFGYCADKFIPDYLLTASVAARENLLEALLLGDGRIDSRRATGKMYRQKVFCTTSPRLAADVERLAISLGHAVRTARYEDRRAERYRDVYEVRLLQKRYRQVRPKHGEHFVEEYRGTVHCAEVPGGLLYVRRGDSVPVWSGNSFKAGVDLRASLYLQRDAQGGMYTKLTNIRTGKTEDVPVHKVEDATIAFPGESKKKTGISALRSGQLVSVSHKEVDYELPHANMMFSVATNMVPMPESVQGNRILMGAKHATQALPLIHREQPLVQVASHNPGRTMCQEVAQMVVPHAPVAGTIRRIDDDYIYLAPSGKKHATLADPDFIPFAPVEYVWTTGDDLKYAEVPVPEFTPMSGMDYPQNDSGTVCEMCNNGATTKVTYNDGQAFKPACADHAINLKEKLGDRFSGFREFEKNAAAENLIKIPYDNNYPLASKTYLHNTIIVKPGDEVEENQHLASSNFTRDGRMALGTNLNVGYLAHYGANTNDAVVISESAAEKLTSEHMYKEAQPLDDDITMSLDKHRALYGSRWTAVQYAHLDSRGVAKAGETLQPGDPIFLAIRKTSPTAEQQMLGKLHRGLSTPYREVAHTWDHRCSGVITDVVVTPLRVLVTIKTQESAAVGDKISNRYGGKGVVSKVIPDGQMPRTPDGKPLELLMPPTGVHGRINPAQIIETALAKVARKTGETVVMESMSGRNNVEYAKKMLKDHGLTDKEVLENPITGKQITGPDGKGIMTGPQYIYKLFKSTETNYSARGVEDYDVNLQPAKGGASGAKALGRMEINALLAHNARNVLKEVSTLKSTKNDEFWRAYQLGLPPPPVRTSFASEKLMEMLRGSGIKVDKSAQHLTLGPMTDADVKQMSSGAITKSLMVKEKDLTPEKGGLFDPVITGGTAGTRWSHVDLHESVVNPVFEDPVRRLLGMTENEFRTTLQNEGGGGISKRLAKLDLDKHADQLKTEIRDASGARLDSIVKQLKALQALQREKLRPENAYILSKLPVVPPVIRPILPSKGRRDLLVADANYLYRDAILANDTLADAKRVLPKEEVGKARLQLYDATKAVFGLADPTSPQLSGRGAKGFISTITGQGSPKHGFFHGKVLYRPQDLSGRGTVAPDLTLDMDEIGLPEEMLWTTYAPHIVRRLVQNGYKAVDAKQMVDDRHTAAADMLAREIKERPVFVNRAPTLHRYNLIGAYPVSVPGKTIRVNPFMEKGMGMDYDGDTLQVHVPVGSEAVKEVRSMTLSNLLFGDKSKNNLLVFPQHEAIIGIHIASAAHGGTSHRFKTNADAIAAYKRGDLKLTDTVEIG